jgi:ABC-2 type transport system permease protein
MATQSIPQLLSPTQNGVFERLWSELRALYWVAKKEWLYFVRYPTWAINLLIWPIIFPLGYILSARALAGPDNSGLVLFTSRTGIQDYYGYIAIGTMVWMVQNVALWGVGFALRTEQWRGTLETNWLSPAWRFIFLFGPAVVHMFTMITFLFVAGMEFALIFGVKFHGNPLLVLLMIFLSMPAVYGLAMAFASLVITAKEAHNFVQMVRGVVMIFCGITFPITLMPEWMQGVARWLPQTYMINSVRSAALGNASFQDLTPDIIALLGFGAFWLAVGYVTFNWMERRARQTGAIGQY